MVDIALILKKIDLTLDDHEQRLQEIEESSPKFRYTQNNLQALKKLCDSLGIQDLEALTSLKG